MKLYYNPLDTACKSTVGAFARESLITLNLYERQGGEDGFSADSCLLVLNRDGEPAEEFPLKKSGDRWTISLRFHREGLYFYHFRVGGRNFSCGRMREGTFTEFPVAWQFTVYEEHFSTPDWLKGGIIYQIFPDRFFKKGDLPLDENRILRKWGDTPFFRPDENGQILNNDFFGGNLNGIREKLSYLKTLNVTAIYLNPIFEAFSNHRYDTGDFFKIDGLLGTMEDFESLIEEANALGIRIILDGVFNHVGADSRYFNRYGRYSDIGAYQSETSPYFEWFRFHSFPEDYDSWWGIKSLPAVDETAASYQNFILGANGVVCHWLKCGIGGFRIDVADELPDLFLKKLRGIAKKEAPEAVIIGEVWEDASNKISYNVRREYFQGEELDSVMNYPLKNAIIDFMLTGKTEVLRSTIAALIDNYPASSLNLLMNSLGTHDTPRILTVLGGRKCFDKEEMAVNRLTESEKKQAVELLKSAVVLQYTLPGVPCVYYGDENGMEGYGDPFCRGCFDWDNLNYELIEFYQKLGKIRSNFLSIFRDGIYREIFADSGSLVFERKSENGSVYIYVNRSDSKYRVNLQGKYKELLTGIICNDFLSIPSHSYGIFTKLTEKN